LDDQGIREGFGERGVAVWTLHSFANYITGVDTYGGKGQLRGAVERAIKRRSAGLAGRGFPFRRLLLGVAWQMAPGSSS
jgi:hypothetical protein